MKIKSFKFTDTDEAILLALRNSLNINTDIGVIRYCLSYVQVGSGAPIEEKKIVKKRKFTDDYIDAMLEKTPFDKGFCPMHPELTISECACFKSDNRKILLKEWLENQYE